MPPHSTPVVQPASSLPTGFLTQRDLDTQASNLRRYERLNRAQLLELIGKAAKQAWIHGESQFEVAIDMDPFHAGCAWLDRYGPQLATVLSQLHVSCSAVTLVLRQAEAARCVETLAALPWVPAPIPAAVYALRYARDCPVLNRFVTRKPSSATGKVTAPPTAPSR